MGGGGVTTVPAAPETVRNGDARSSASTATPDPSLSISVFIADGDDQIAHWGLFNYMLSPHVRANNTADAIIHVVIRINSFSANAVRLGARAAVPCCSIAAPFAINLQLP